MPVPEATSAQRVSGLSARSRAVTAIKSLEDRFSSEMVVNPELDRSLVSFQKNKAEPVYRWFKYREGFSRLLIDYVFDQVGATATDTILDPFAGTGAATFVAAERGMRGVAIELLPVGCFFMTTRELIASRERQHWAGLASSSAVTQPWRAKGGLWRFPHIRITDGAFPAATEKGMSAYMSWASGLDPDDRAFFEFVLFSVLEEISYTRKDGQYLRWDYRAPGRSRPTKFDKGKIQTLDEAIVSKLTTIASDMGSIEPSPVSRGPAKPQSAGAVEVVQGSVFEKVRLIEPGSISHVMTSPPYCNRYDYTRTYALELAFLGVGEDDIRSLRQALLTCTVENRPKEFEGVGTAFLERSLRAVESVDALTKILQFLDDEKGAGLLNNNGIVSMVRGYFFDSALHLAQASVCIKPGGTYVMVNDNVQYNGVGIPVDCILSAIAEELGFTCEVIWTLPVGKGNSSQQMKVHGRRQLRKSVYVWRRNS